MRPDGCVFCAIVTGKIPSTAVHETDRTLAFRDLGAQAPTHVLVVPKDHHEDLAALSDADPVLLAQVLAAAVEVSRQEGLTGGYRLVANSGPDAGQSVQHLHLHVLGGRSLGWPPG